MKSVSIFRISLATVALGVGLTLPAFSFAADQDASGDKTVTGEVVDLMCYLDHGAKGDKHQGCAEKCIKGGGPVGILSKDQVYLVVGEHKPINDELAPQAGKTVTLKGKVVERSGMKMIENAQLQK